MKMKKMLVMGLSASIMLGSFTVSGFAATNANNDLSNTSTNLVETDGTYIDDNPILSNEDYVNQLLGLTKAEKKELLRIYEEADKISAEVDKIWGDKEELTADEEKAVNNLWDKLDVLYEKADKIESKSVYIDKETKGYLAKEKNLIKESNLLTEAEKVQLFKAYDEIIMLMTEIEGIYQGKEEVSTADLNRIKEIDSKIDKIYESIEEIDMKLAVPVLY